MAAISTPEMARAARACVCELLPPPMRPMCVGIALFAFAAEVNAVHAGVVHLGDGGGAAARVGEDFGFVGRSFQSACHAEAEHAFFIVGEYNFFAKGMQSRDAIHAAEVWAATKDEAGVFFENGLLLPGYPIRFDFEHAPVGAALCGDDRAVANDAHLRGVFGLDGFGIVPEVEAVDITVVEPETDMMRMVHAFAGAGLERIAARD